MKSESYTNSTPVITKGDVNIVSTFIESEQMVGLKTNVSCIKVICFTAIRQN